MDLFTSKQKPFSHIQTCPSCSKGRMIYHSNILNSSQEVQKLLAVSGNLKDSLKLIESDYQFFPSGHSDAINCIDSTEDLEIIATGASDSSVRIWNGHTSYQLGYHFFHLNPVNSVCISRNKSYVVSGSDDKNIIVYSIERRSCVHSFLGHKRNIRCVRLTHDDKYLISSASDRIVKIWNMTDFTFLKDLEPHLGQVPAIDVGDSVFVTGDSKGNIRLWEIDGWCKIKATKFIMGIANIKIICKYKVLALTQDWEVKLVDLEDGKLIMKVDVGMKVSGMFLINEEVAYILKENDIMVLNLGDHNFTQTSENGYQGVQCATYTRGRFITGSKDRSIKIYDTSNTTLITFACHLGYIEQIEFIPESLILITSGDDYTIRFWDLTKKIKYDFIIEHKKEIIKFSMNQNRRYIISITSDLSAHVYKLSNILLK